MYFNGQIKYHIIFFVKLCETIEVSKVNKMVLNYKITIKSKLIWQYFIVLAYTFPSTLTSEERKYLHLKCAELGLKSKSHGLVKKKTYLQFKY